MTVTSGAPDRTRGQLRTPYLGCRHQRKWRLAFQVIIRTDKAHNYPDWEKINDDKIFHNTSTQVARNVFRRVC